MHNRVAQSGQHLYRRFGLGRQGVLQAGIELLVPKASQTVHFSLFT
jgi:hypothetical protein